MVGCPGCAVPSAGLKYWAVASENTKGNRLYHPEAHQHRQTRSQYCRLQPTWRTSVWWNYILWPVSFHESVFATNHHQVDLRHLLLCSSFFAHFWFLPGIYVETRWDSIVPLLNRRFSGPLEAVWVWSACYMVILRSKDKHMGAMVDKCSHITVV